MSGSNSPDPASQLVDHADDAPATANGHLTPPLLPEDKNRPSPVASIAGDAAELPDAPAQVENGEHVVTNGGDEDAASEAETLISSPVKRREAEKQNAAIKREKPLRSRIGGLPVPHDDDDDAESAASPMPTTEISIGKATAKDEDDFEMQDEGDDDDDSDQLSSEPASNLQSRATSRSRALSERPDLTSRDHNPKKRKHRASSVGLPNSKRRSMDPPQKRKLRGMNSEDNMKTERSPSPRLRAHKRAFSTQSALDGTAEGGGRKRKGGPVKESKSSKSTWEESDASSEATSRGNDDSRRPQRGVGRSTSTPGRPGGREHKRHINKYGFTKLAEACEEDDLDTVKEWREKDPDQLELAEFAGNKPLQIAALNGNAEVVEYLIEQGCQIDCANVDKDTPLIDASENGHLEVVKLLLDAGVDPMRQNLKGQQALDVVTEDEEFAPKIRAALHAAIDAWNSSEAKQRREVEEEQRHRAGPSKELHFMARTYENLLKLVQNNDRNGVQEFLAARVPVDNVIIAAAAKTGDLYLVNMLLAEMTEKKAHQKPEKPMLSVLGTSHFEMVKALTELDQFNPAWRNRQGKTWPEIAEERNGQMWRQEKELLLRLYNASAGSKQVGSSSPVTKRENGMRRVPMNHDEDDESEEDGDSPNARKRKNGRRLMSRKDMRRRGPPSDSDAEDEEDGSTSDTPAAAVPKDTTPSKQKEEEDVPAKKPPDSPTTRRAAERLRAKSSASQPGSTETSPKTKTLRKRTGSFRTTAAADKPVHALPTVDEKADDANTEGPSKGDSAEETVQVSSPNKKQKNREEAAKFAAEQAQRLEQKRKEEVEAEAEAKRAEEEAIRKADEERQAEEQRKAIEEAERKEAERMAEEMRAEQARIAEEERKQRELEELERRKQYRSEVLQALPPPLARVLDAETTGFNYEGLEDKSWLVQYYTPLHLLFDASDSASQPWVLNIQIAALLGKSGLELFFSEQCPYFSSSLASQWTSADITPDDHRLVDKILTSIFEADTHAFPDESSLFQSDLARAAERYNALLSFKRSLHQPDCAAKLRRIRLDDVLRNLHSLLRGSRIDVKYSHRSADTTKEPEVAQSFFERLQRFWKNGHLPGAIVSADEAVQQRHVGPEVGLGRLVVVHEK